MDHPSVATPPLTGLESASTAQEQHGRTEGSTMEPPPAGYQGAGSFVRRDKDLAEEGQLERRDTAESCLSNFSHQRSDTNSSIAWSTVTDMTDLNSLDAEEAPDNESGIYLSSSPRHSNFPPHLMVSQKRLPFRALSISCDSEKSRAAPYGSSPGTPVSRHRRLEERASRKSSLGIYSSAAVPTAGPRPPSRREASPPDTLEPWTTTDDSNFQQPVDRDLADGEPCRSMVDPAYPPSALAQEDTADEIRSREDGMDFSVQAEDSAPTSREATPDANTIDAAEFGAGRGTPPKPSRSRLGCSGISDVCNQGNTQPDDSIIHEVCDQILQQAFGVQLRDVALAGAISAAYESVSYCLDELSHIVLNSGLSNTGILISEATRDGTGSSTAPLWPIGSAADTVGTGGWNGAGGGSRKRSNGGHDGTDSSDGAGDGSPGGGKRQRLSSTQHQSPDLHFSCPFRKRNPVRFNVRDFQSCAVQSFPDIPQLKRHVKNFHKQRPLLPFTCQRCGQAMGTQEALTEHASVGRDQICNPQKVPPSADPEDGITSGIEEALNGRKAGSKIDCWETLWRHLFPDDSRIPESDFVPPTELDEVYAQFNSDCCTHQLRQQIQERLGPASDAGSMFAVFNNHIESVFEACKLKTSGVAGGRRRLRLQTPRPMTSRRNSVLLTPMHPTPGRRRSDSSISSQIATPNSTYMPGNLEQPFMVESQRHAPYAPPNGSYDGPGVGATGALMMPLAAGGSPSANQGGQPVAVPPPAHIHLRFGSQDENIVPLGGQLGHHPRLLATDSGLDLSAPFTDQQVVGFSNVPLFESQHDYRIAPIFEHQVPGLHLRPPAQEMHDMHEQVFSPASQDLPLLDFEDLSWDTGHGQR